MNKLLFLRARLTTRVICMLRTSAYVLSTLIFKLTSILRLVTYATEISQSTAKPAGFVAIKSFLRHVRDQNQSAEKPVASQQLLPYSGWSRTRPELVRQLRSVLAS